MAWAKIPTAWITHDSKLPGFSWKQHGSNATAALILFIALAIRLNQSKIGKKVGQDRSRPSFRASYENLQTLTALSRAKIAAGLHFLKELEMINVSRKGRMNQYLLRGITEYGNWAQLPQTHLLGPGGLPFSKFQLRHRNELNALKLYLLLLAYRNTKTNFTALGYDKICDLSGLMKNDVPPALSLLINLDLVRVEQDEPINGEVGRPHNRYRIRGLSAHF